MTARKPNAVRDDSPKDDASQAKAKAAAEKADDKVSGQIQEKVDEATGAGLFGVEVDPTPNEHYTVPGRLAGKPVPELDDAAAKAARERLTALGQDPRA